MLYVLIAVIAIIAVGYFIYKRVHAASAIFAVGVLLLMIAAATGRVDQTSLEIEPSGNAFYDELLVVEELFKSRFSGTGMAIMVLFGFVGYMSHIGADAKTVVALSRPLRRFHGSYWLVPLGFAIGTGLSLVVPSASALSLLLVATLLPALIAAGLTPLTVAAIIVTASTIVPTPLEAGLIQGSELLGISATEFAFGNVAKATVPALIVTAFVHMWWQWRCDKKDLAKAEAGEIPTLETSNERMEEATRRAAGLPGFYAILPLLPLVLIIISAVLNRLGVVAFEAEILPVTVVSLLATMVIEAIRRRNLNEAVDNLNHTTAKNITRMNADEFLPFLAWECEDKARQIQREYPSVTWTEALDDFSSPFFRITGPDTQGYRGLIPAELDTASKTSKHTTVSTLTDLAELGYIIWDPLNRAHVLSTPA